MHKHVLIAAAGTAGHLYPAMALAKELIEKGYTVTFCGHGLSSNPYFEKETFSYFDTLSPAPSKHPIRFLKNLFLYLLSALKTRRFLKKHHVSFAVGFGSYHSFASILGCIFANVPFALFESNSMLGVVNRSFAKKAKCLAFQLFDLEKVEGASLHKVRMPIDQKRLFQIEKDKARKYYGLQEDLFTLLVFGGSQGAASVNQLFLDSLAKINEREFQVIHIIGSNTNEEETKKVYQALGIPCYVTSFEKTMSRAYSAADMVVCRSGANSIYEQLYFKIPAIFIPFPFLKDKHQLHNARAVCKTHGAGIILEQKSLDSQKLALEINSFMKQESINSYKEKLNQSRAKDADQRLSELIDHLCKKV